ncbi:hypothetical protein [Endozoicomonas atrinae]|uniref:hypothetical protein n=1 Tax=Endozoicomonas atrinae TaxID=1333660 RepID=UPI001112D725|nr:hypothetical protein [Endozoicomonas atrinae]
MDNKSFHGYGAIQSDRKTGHGFNNHYCIAVVASRHALTFSSVICRNLSERQVLRSRGSHGVSWNRFNVLLLSANSTMARPNR